MVTRLNTEYLGPMFLGQELCLGIMRFLTKN